MLVHITFEKITGLKGTFEGDFFCDSHINISLPITFNSFILHKNEFVFTQDGKYLFFRAVEPLTTLNYLEHFYYGVNFLIKEWSHGRGEKGYSQNPN